MFHWYLSKIYKELHSLPVFTGTVARHPSLAAACYLISKGGDPEGGGALSKSKETNVSELLNYYVSSRMEGNGKFPSMASETKDVCVKCAMPSYPQRFECCNKKSSLFCSTCLIKIKLCPTCKHPNQLYSPEATTVSDLL